MKLLSLLVMAIAISCCSYAQLPPAVAHYDFNGNVNDLTANAHNGIIHGAPVYVPVPGGALGLQFNGPTDYVEIPSSTAFDMQEWTISAKVYMNAFESKLPCQVSKIMQRGHQYQGDYICMEINDNYLDNNDCGHYAAADQQIQGAAAGTIGTYITPPPSVGTIALGTWYCLTVTYTNNVLSCYINGVLTHSENWTNQYNVGPYTYPAGVPFLIGRGTGSGGTTYGLRGIIRDVTIYNTPLTASQVAIDCQGAVACSVDDISYCSAVSTPFNYTFTPVTMPAASCVMWDFGDGTGTVTSAAGASVSHTFIGGGSFNVCAQTVDCNTGALCGNPTCFNMCIDPVSGAKHAANTGVTNTGSLEQHIGTPYPNPANSMLNIPSQGIKGMVTMSVTSIDGRLISSKSVNASEANGLLQVNTADLKPGVYMLEITSGSQKTVKKFSKL